ncbi:MAG: ABC transporter permease, partial [Planctomycetota bacterium]
MSPWSYIAASLMHRWRINLSVAAGVAVATAVITGALIVGDSMRGSLRDLAIERLGRVDLALLADHPFRSALADELLSIDAIARNYSSATPLLLTQGAATARSGEVQRRAANLTVAGVPTDFWSLARRQDAAGGPDLAGNRAALTRNVAAELGVDAGDYLVLRIPLRGSVPADSSLGEKQDTVATRRLEVAAVLDPTAAMSQFSLIPNQTDPRNLFLSAATLQRMLDLTEQANAVVFAAATDVEVGPTALESVRANLHPPLVDFGLQVEELPPQGAARKRLQISSDRPVLNRHVVETVQGLYGPENVQSVVTYLANTIASGEKKIPYSTVSGVASSTELGPLLDEDGRPIQLQEDEVALNDWAATDLGVEVGDDVLLTYYEPETTHGALREATPLRLTLRYVAPLTDANGELTLANDERFAPELPGVTDQQSISDWDLPFELVETIRRVDEDYWDDYRTTPKAFLSPTVAERLW